MRKRIDLTGQKFGRWNVIKRIECGAKSKWECVCNKCGAIKNILYGGLVYKTPKYCKNCDRYLSFGNKPKNDYTGKRIHMLVALYPFRKEWSKLWWWKCKCDCGNETEISSNSFKNSYVKSCGCLLEKQGRESHNWRGYEEISGQFWNKCLQNAKIRNLNFDITIEQMWKLFLKQGRRCALTGMNIDLLQKNSYTKISASLDRIDSSRGYEINNVQWIHKDVNRMKNSYSQEYFIKICKMVCKNNEKID